MKLPAEPRPDQLTSGIDTREQPGTEWDLSPLQTQRTTLATGDYTIIGLEHCIALERKSLSDFLGCVGRDRERFERECQRLLGYETRAIIIEATWADLERGEWKSKVTPKAAIGSALGWIAQGIPVVMAGDHQRAGQMASRILFIAARRRWREARTLANGITDRKEK